VRAGARKRNVPRHVEAKRLIDEEGGPCPACACFVEEDIDLVTVTSSSGGGKSVLETAFFDSSTELQRQSTWRASIRARRCCKRCCIVGPLHSCRPYCVHSCSVSGCIAWAACHAWFCDSRPCRFMRCKQDAVCCKKVQNIDGMDDSSVHSVDTAIDASLSDSTQCDCTTAWAIASIWKLRAFLEMRSFPEQTDSSRLTDADRSRTYVASHGYSRQHHRPGHRDDSASTELVGLKRLSLAPELPETIIQDIPSKLIPWPRVPPWLYSELGPICSGTGCICNGTNVVLWGAKLMAAMSLAFDHFLGIYGGFIVLEEAPEQSSDAHRARLSAASVVSLTFYLLQRLLLRVLLAWITIALVNRSIERQRLQA